MHDFLISVLSPSGVIYTLAVAACGAFCSHRFDLWREKRKEFNAFAEPIFNALNLQIPYASTSPYGQIADIQTGLLDRYFWPHERTAFHAAVIRYNNAGTKANGTYNNDDASVTRSPESLIELQESIAGLLKFVKPR